MPFSVLTLIAATNVLILLEGEFEHLKMPKMTHSGWNDNLYEDLYVGHIDASRWASRQDYVGYKFAQ